MYRLKNIMLCMARQTGDFRNTTLAVPDYSGSSLPLDECFGKDVTKEVKNIINFSVDNKIKQLEAELEAINTPSRKKRA